MAAVMTVGLLAGCGGKSLEDQAAAQEGEGTGAAVETVEMAGADEVDGTEITFWHSMGGVNGQAIDELVKRFNEQNELGITVVSEFQGEYDDALNKLRSAQIGSMGADLVQVYEIGTIPAGSFRCSRWWMRTITIFRRSSRTWPRIIQSMTSCIPCRSIHPHR